MTVEEWKDVVGYEGLYQVSSLGRVKRLVGYQCCVERVLKPGKRRDGYLQVALYRDGKATNKRVHRLVAKAFLGDAPEGYEVNHRNGDKADNRAENLEWVTASENRKHTYRVLGKTGPIGETNGRSNRTRREVVEIRKLWATDKYTQVELSEMFGVPPYDISRIVNRKRWKHVS